MTQVPAGKADATLTPTDHKDHHNLLAAGVNAAMGRWMTVMQAHVNLSAAPIGSFTSHESVSEDVQFAEASPGHFRIVQHYLDPADYAISGWTLEYRLVASFLQNAVANTATAVMTAGLYPVIPGGPTTTLLNTFGAVIAGSTAAKTGGAASSESRTISSAFAAPAADTYMMGVGVSAAATAGATKIGLRLEAHYV